MDTLNRFTLHSFIKVLSVLTMTYFSLSAYSSVQEPSGVITFTGNIVNAPCLVSQDKPSDLRFGCLDEHANMKISILINWHIQLKPQYFQITLEVMNSNGCEMTIKKGSLKLDINKLKRVFRKGTNKEPFLRLRVTINLIVLFSIPLSVNKLPR